VTFNYSRELRHSAVDLVVDHLVIAEEAKPGYFLYAFRYPTVHGRWVVAPTLEAFTLHLGAGGNEQDHYRIWIASSHLPGTLQIDL